MFSTIINKDILVAKKYLDAGEVVGLPTETVYGLAANALNEDAVLKIFSVKNRPHFDPLIVHVFSVEEMKKYVEEIPEKASVIMKKFMPGPVTLLLKKKKIIPDLVTSGLDTVAIRIPQHPVALSLLRLLDFPVAAPSANPFGYISPTTALHVYEQLQSKIPFILDGGPATVGLESTIIGFDGEQPVLYRPGGLPVEEIEAAIGKIEVNTGEESQPLSPGMLKSHYAPRKKLVFDNLTPPSTGKAGVIAFNKYAEGIEQANQILLSPKGDIVEAAKNLFSAMRQLDASDVDIILAVKFPQSGLGRAINDRLKRASA